MISLSCGTGGTTVFHMGQPPSTFILTNQNHHLSALLSEASQIIRCNVLYLQKWIFKIHFPCVYEARSRYSGFQTSAETCSQVFVRVTFQTVFGCLPHISLFFSVSAAIPTTPNHAITLCSLLRIVQALFLAGI